jgi:hypothetical protein
MKQYVIDELRPVDYQKIKEYLDAHHGSSEITGIYWIPIDPEYLTFEQAEHTECGPHFIVMILEEHMLACEFLVRTKHRIRCSCMGYADDRQRKWIMDFADAIFSTLEIKI